GLVLPGTVLNPLARSDGWRDPPPPRNYATDPRLGANRIGRAISRPHCLLVAEAQTKRRTKHGSGIGGRGRRRAAVRLHLPCFRGAGATAPPGLLPGPAARHHRAPLGGRRSPTAHPRPGNAPRPPRSGSAARRWLPRLPRTIDQARPGAPPAIGGLLHRAGDAAS